MKRDRFDAAAAAALADAIGVASGQCCGHTTIDSVGMTFDDDTLVPAEYHVLEQLEVLGWKLVSAVEQRLRDARQLAVCRRLAYRVNRACDAYRWEWSGRSSNSCDTAAGPVGGQR